MVHLPSCSRDGCRLGCSYLQQCRKGTGNGMQGMVGGCGSFLLPLNQHLTRSGAGCSSRQGRSLSLLHHDGSQFHFWVAFALLCCHQQCPSATQHNLQSRDLCSYGFKVGKRQGMPFLGRSILQNLPTS